MTSIRPSSVPLVFLLPLLLLAGACGGETSSALNAPDLRADRPAHAGGGNGGGGGGDGGDTGTTSDPTVSDVTPDSAFQSLTLDVEVTGDGFDEGSVVSWAIDSVETTAITTNRTTFVSKRKLVANITVDSDAPTLLYDAVVTTGRGRRGIGTELLEVKEGLLDATFEEAADASVGSLTDDGGSSSYRAFRLENGNFQTRIGIEENEWKENADRCVTVHVTAASDGGTLFGPACVTVENMATRAVDDGDANLALMPTGATAPTRANVLFETDRRKFAQLWYGAAKTDCDGGGGVPSDPATKASVTRLTGRSWTITADSALFCERTGKRFTPVLARATFTIGALEP